MLKGLTRRYTVCPVAAFLKNELPFPVYIGWGCSANVIQAHRNAQYGMKEAKQNKQTASYVVTAEKQVIGPLSVSYQKDGEELLQGKLTHLSKVSGVSLQRLQQIYSMARQAGDGDRQCGGIGPDAANHGAQRVPNPEKAGGLRSRTGGI